MNRNISYFEQGTSNNFSYLYLLNRSIINLLLQGEKMCSTKIFPLLCILGIGTIVAASKPEKTDERIIGGDVVTQGALPYIVTIEQVRNDPFQPRKPYCVGTILNREWILTTASCATLPKSKYVITAGAIDISQSNTGFGELIREVTQIIMHEDFDSTTMQNDVALMKMHLPVYDPFFNGRIKSINLVSPTTTCLDNFSSGQVIVGGWGITNNSQSLGTNNNKLLRSVRLPIIQTSICVTNYAGYSMHPTANNFCAGSVGKAPCTGDFGGPALCRDSCGTVTLPTPAIKASESESVAQQPDAEKELIEIDEQEEAAAEGRKNGHNPTVTVSQSHPAPAPGHNATATSQMQPETFFPPPVEQNYVVCGLVSFSKLNQCGKAGSPTVMVRIPKYVNWIKQTLSNNY